jgi:ABC-type branched-subunit amino acid transport system permease subunit
MGQNLIIVVFAVVVIGGMGSIMGSILTGLGLGVIEGLTKVFYPEASSTGVLHHGHRSADPPRRPVRQRKVSRASHMNSKKLAFTGYGLLLGLIVAPSSGPTRCS